MGLAEKRLMIELTEKVINPLVKEASGKLGLNVTVTTEGALPLVEGYSLDTVSNSVTSLFKDGIFAALFEIVKDDFGKKALLEKFKSIKIDLLDQSYANDDAVVFDGSTLVIRRHPLTNTDTSGLNDLCKFIQKKVEAQL